MSAPTRWGDPFAFEPAHLNGMRNVSMAPLEDGGFMTVWVGTGTNTLFTKIFNADGTARSGAISIPGSQSPNVMGPDIAVMKDGSYVVTWGENIMDGGLKAAIFAANGQLRKSAFNVSDIVSPFQDVIVAVPLDEGGFMAVYSRSTGDGDGYSVIGRSFDAAGNPKTGEFVVNGTTASSQNFPSAASLRDGNVVAAYIDAGTPGGLTIRARILKPDGTVAHAEILVPTSEGHKYDPSVTALSDGRFVVVWNSPEFGETGVRAQILAANGDKVGGELVVNSTTVLRQMKPVVSALADGGFAVVFEDQSQSPSPTELNYDVRVVTFNGAGERQSNDVLVHDVSTGQQLQPTIMTLADGRFVVGWTDGTTTTNGKISAQIFDARIAGVTLNGTAGNDHYVGTAFIDRLDGGAGNDRLVGGDGNDVLYAGAGQDTIDGGRGADYVDYARSVTGVGVTVDLVDQSQNKGDAAGDHYLEVENITGTPWDDVLYGTDDVNELNGGDGADILVGRDGGDTLNGGEGFDYASYEDAPAGVFARLNKGEGGSLGPDLNDNDALGDVWISIEGLIGSAFEDHLWGGINDNILIGGGGDDQLSGFGGSDTLEGGVGADLLLGGEGIDYANYAHAQAGVTVDLRNVIQLPGFVHTPFAATDEGAGDKFEFIEGVIGSDFGDVLIGDDAVNTLLGGAGDDRLDGGLGTDQLVGGMGDDTYLFDGGDIVVELAGGGFDTIQTSLDYTLGDAFEALVATGSANMALIGNAAANAITGNAGANRIDGAGGADTLSGQSGDDTYWVQADDTVIETSGGGVDTVIALASHSLRTDAEVETLTLAALSSSVSYTLVGSDSANRINGHSGKNTLKGLGGNDQLWGGLGIDTLYGNGGRDTFVFNTKLGRTNVDSIKDFSVKDDTIWLDNKYFTKLSARGTEAKPVQLSKSAFHVGSAAHDASDRIIYDNKKGALYYDADGIGGRAAVQIATLSKKLKMTYKDFFVI